MKLYDNKRSYGNYLMKYYLIINVFLVSLKYNQRMKNEYYSIVPHDQGKEKVLNSLEVH